MAIYTLVKICGQKRSIIYNVEINEALLTQNFQTKQLSVCQHGEFK